VSARRRGRREANHPTTRVIFLSSPVDNRQGSRYVVDCLQEVSDVARPTKSDLLQGTLDLLILKTLALGPQHGWGISQRIQQISQDVLQVNQGSLYPALHRLEEQGWIAAEWGVSEANRQARFYSLTRSGRRQLGVQEEQWARITAAVGRILDAT
jgi:PadR family transcriptional regulator PadR